MSVQVSQIVLYLTGLEDVNIVTPTNGQALIYDSTSGMWVNGSITGAVTSVSNSDGTLTISPTTGDVVASLNLGHANTWTALQKFTYGDLALLGNGVVGYVTLEVGAVTTNTYVATFPPNTGIVAELNYAETWSALQTFNNNDFAIMSSGGTYYYTFAGAAIGANYTLTLPLMTGADTLAALGTAQTWSATQTFATVQMTGLMTEYNNIATAGNGLLAEYGSQSEKEITALTATTIVTYSVPVSGAGNYMVFAYFRVATASTVVSLSASWTDKTGANIYTWVLNTLTSPVGSYVVPALFINAAASTTISVSATVGTVNQVYVSASIVAM